MIEIKKRNQAYESSQKRKLEILAQGDTPYADIIAYVKEQDTLSRRKSNFKHEISCFKEDGVYQLNRAITQIVGVAQASKDDNPSGKESPIDTVGVTLADGTKLRVPYGRIDLPDAGEDAHIDIAYNTDTNNLIVKGTCQFRFSALIDDIVSATKHLLNTDSIYRNQAFEIDSKFQPKIMDLSNIDKEFMVLTKESETQLMPLYARINNPEKCRAKGIPLKTGVLLSGPYGTGKTLAAFKIAKQAIGNNWAFIYLKDPNLLAQTLRMSKTLDNNGNGMIVFLEDVDQVTRGNRDAAMQDILNTLDGGDTKQMNVIAIFTTNHLELIEPTFLRAKRIGNLVHMGYLDAETARRFIDHTFANEYIIEEEGMDEVLELIANSNIVPAFMAEITEKVKANLVFKDDNVITALDLKSSLDSYLRQVALTAVKDMGKSPAEIFASSFASVMFESENGKKLIEQVEEIYNNQ